MLMISSFFAVDLSHHRKDDVCCGQVPGFVHAMSLSKDGSTLAVVYGATIAFIRNPFRGESMQIPHAQLTFIIFSSGRRSRPDNGAPHGTTD